MRIEELNEVIRELQFQEKTIMEMFEIKDAKGMKQVAGEISKSEKRVEDLDEQEVELPTRTIGRRRNSMG